MFYSEKDVFNSSRVLPISTFYKKEMFYTCAVMIFGYLDLKYVWLNKWVLNLKCHQILTVESEQVCMISDVHIG